MNNEEIPMWKMPADHYGMPMPLNTAAKLFDLEVENTALKQALTSAQTDTRLLALRLDAIYRQLKRSNCE